MEENIRTKMNTPVEYDAIESEVWAKNILPVLNELKTQCELNHIPFAASFAVINKEGHTKYYHEAVLPKADSLYENNFGKYILALQGAYVSPYDAAHDMTETLNAYNSAGDEEDE